MQTTKTEGENNRSDSLDSSDALKYSDPLATPKGAQQSTDALGKKWKERITNEHQPPDRRGCPGPSTLPHSQEQLNNCLISIFQTSFPSMWWWKS